MQSDFCRAIKSLVAVSVVASLVGCVTNPLLDWDRNVEKNPAQNLETARVYAGQSRQILRDAMRAQVGTESNVSNSLLAIMGLTGALAYGKVHRDVLVGTGIIAGTAYGIENRNYSLQRVMLYQSGIQAINCAEGVICAFDMNDDKAMISTQLDKLSGDEANIRKESNNVRSILKRIKSPSGNLADKVTAATDAANAADRVADGIAAAAKTGRSLLTMANGAPSQLVNAVRSVQDAVDKQAIATLPNLQSVLDSSKQIQNVATAVSGLNIESIMSDSLNAYSAKKTPPLSDSSTTPGQNNASFIGETKKRNIELPKPDGNESLLDAAIDTLATVTRDASIALNRVNTYLNAYSMRSFAGLSACTVAPVQALAVNPQSTTFAGKTTEGIMLTVTGGVAPYTLQVMESPAEGISISPAVLRNSGTVLLQVTDKAKGPKTYHILITDSAQQPNSVNFEMKIGS